MSYGISSTGFSRPRLIDIQTAIQQTLQATFGQGINLSAESIFGQLVGIFSEREDLLWQGLQDVYNSQYPDTAFGVSLDNVAALTGTQRLAAKPAFVALTLTGAVGTIIPAGSLVSVPNGGPQFQTLAQVAIGSGGTVTVTAESSVSGNITALAGTISKIVTPINGWSAVTNPADATTGSTEESDSALRIRRAAQLQKAGSGTLEAIRSRLLAVTGVFQAIVFENDSDEPDTASRPPHSFECFVAGGAAQNIADTIWAAKPAGIQPFGTIATPITDSQGLTHIINWSRPIQKSIYCIVNLTVNPTKFPTTGAASALAAVLAYGLGLGIGDPVIVSPSMVSSLSAITGILNAQILVGLSANPTSSSNIIQAINELAVFDSSRVVVNVL
jgi:uncharacterized phage protein gp47/JayE